MWPFRPPQTAPDLLDNHRTTLDLIEQVAALRGQVRAMETEWDDAKAQIKKAYQRMEKANQRADERLEGNTLPDSDEDHVPERAPPTPSASGFAGKLLELQRLRQG